MHKSIRNHTERISLQNMLQHSPVDFQVVFKLIRELRHRGDAVAVKGMLRSLQHVPCSAVDAAQLGIEMSITGMWPEAQERLRHSLQSPVIQGYNRTAILRELSIALFSLGQYEEALDLVIRGRSDVHHTLMGMLGAESKDLELIKSKYWQGQNLSGQTILLLLEGGAGDLFMHSRYFNDLLSDGASKIYIECDLVLHAVLSHHPRIESVKSTDYRHKADKISTTFEVFHRYQKHPFEQPKQPAPELFKAPHQLSSQAQRLLDQATGLRIGLVTTSATDVRHEPFRSISESSIIPLLDGVQDHHVNWFCLNRGGNTPLSPHTIATYNIANLEPYLHTFADTAAIVRQLDLLISIDTGSAHLSATLGCRTWLLLAANCDSRWLELQHHTPWYPSMRLFRQSELGEWSQPVSQMIELLSREIQRRNPARLHSPHQ